MLLVVGATGQLGGVVSAKLVAAGHRVRALVREPSRGRRLAARGAELIQGDLRDRESLERACRGARAVLSTASTIVPRKGDRFGADDLDGYRNLLAACSGCGVEQLVYVSAFRSRWEHTIPEFVIKRAVEAEIVGSGVPYTILRGAAFMDVYFSIMGSELPMRGVDHPTLGRGFWLTTLFRGLLGATIDQRGVAVVPGSGRTRHAFIAIDDVSELMVRVLGKPQALNLVQDISGPEALSWDEVAETFAAVLHRRVRRVHMPSTLLGLARSCAAPFSPAAANLLAILGLISREDHLITSQPFASSLGLELTSARAFLERCAEHAESE